MRISLRSLWGLVNEQGKLAHYSGTLRVVDATGNVVADHLSPADYANFIGEAVEPWSYLKSAYYKPYGYPDGIYRVGPLARLNVADGCSTPRAHEEWAEFRQNGIVSSSFHYHVARLIEILYGIERIQELLSDPSISEQACARLCKTECVRRYRRGGSAARHVVSSLQD